jgi:hypothetical protein
MRLATGVTTAALTVLVLMRPATARADRVLATRTPGLRNPGARTDITVPYLTTGYTAFMPGRFVGVRIYSSEMVDDPWVPGQPPVYNLPFYGGIMAFGTRSNGAMPTGLVVTPRETSPAVRPGAAMPNGTVLTIR